MSEERKEVLFRVLIIIFVILGAMAGMIGFGIGLIWLSIPQAFGLGIVSFASGTLAWLLLGFTRISKIIMKTMDEMDEKQNRHPKASS
jgi:hypothetical protein